MSVTHDTSSHKSRACSVHGYDRGRYSYVFQLSCSLPPMCPSATNLPDEIADVDDHTFLVQPENSEQLLAADHWSV